MKIKKWSDYLNIYDTISESAIRAGINGERISIFSDRLPNVAIGEKRAAELVSVAETRSLTVKIPLVGSASCGDGRLNNQHTAINVAQTGKD